MPRLLVRGRAESWNVMALLATGATSRFLDASGKGTALPEYFEQNEAIPSSALQR